MRNRNAYKSLPYNPDLLDRANELRQAGNLCEVILWKQLHKNKFRNFDFDRQKIIGDYIVDFYCGNRNVVIEIDGSTHNNKIRYDKKRDEFFEGLGLTVIHIAARDVLYRLDNVMLMLESHPDLRGGEFAIPSARVRTDSSEHEYTTKKNPARIERGFAVIHTIMLFLETTGRLIQVFYP